jgi:hypothetical protein
LRAERCWRSRPHFLLSVSAAVLRSKPEKLPGQAQTCLSAAYDAIEAAPIRAHEPYNVNDATLAQLSDSSLATPDEIRSIEATYPHLKTCYTRLVARLGALAPTIAPIFAENSQLTENDMLALVERRMLGRIHEAAP